jgi:ankyrin repeat protein
MDRTDEGEGGLPTTQLRDADEEMVATNKTNWRDAAKCAERADLSFRMDAAIADAQARGGNVMEARLRVDEAWNCERMDRVMAAEAAAEVKFTTPLHDAAKGGDEETVGTLLAAGAELEETNHAGQTPLHCACKKDFGEIVELLLAAGAHTSTKDTDGYTPLHRAASSQSVEVLRILLAAASKDTNSRLANARNNRGDSALHDASPEGSLTIVRMLLNAGADLSAKNQSGDTPLHMAVNVDQGEVVTLLLAAGADTAAKDERHGATPLHIAASVRNDKTARMLLDAGADVSAVDNDGWTALHGVVRGELREGMDIGDGDDRAVHNFGIMLLDAGADHSAMDNKGATPLDLATERTLLETMGMLLEAGAAPSVAQLHIVIRYSSSSLLLSRLELSDKQVYKP